MAAMRNSVGFGPGRCRLVSLIPNRSCPAVGPRVIRSQLLPYTKTSARFGYWLAWSCSAALSLLLSLPLQHRRLLRIDADRPAVGPQPVHLGGGGEDEQVIAVAHL